MGKGLVHNPGASSDADDELLSWLVEDVIAEGVYGADVVDKVLVHPNAGIESLSRTLSSS